MATSFAGQMRRKTTGMATKISGASRTSVARAAQQMKRAVETTLDRDVPGRVLKRVGKKGARLSVSYRVRDNRSDSSAMLRAVGPWQIINNPAKPHKIYRKGARQKGRGARRANRQAIFNELFGATGAYTGGALSMPDGRYRHVVDHPGHAGKQTWQRGVAAGRPEAEQTMRRSTRDALIEGMRSR